jgi:hypothetical protein
MAEQRGTVGQTRNRFTYLKVEDAFIHSGTALFLQKKTTFLRRLPDKIILKEFVKTSQRERYNVVFIEC